MSEAARREALAVQAEELWLRRKYPDEPAKAEEAIARARQMSREHGMRIEAAFRSVRNQIDAKWWVPTGRGDPS